MSHEKQGTAYDPKVRGHERQGRKSAPRHVWLASDYIRPDFTTAMLIEFLEAKARGYNGSLRALLCTSAAALRDQKAALLRYEEAADAAATELDEVVNEMRVQGDLAEMAARDES